MCSGTKQPDVYWSVLLHSFCTDFWVVPYAGGGIGDVDPLILI